ncbi:J domain-containing protein [Leptolyngbya sp. NIES-2104]|uniref:J domain-containing protein n=1 Tax=Leptolyngbya sp. NIES-2104 TaxID=1552121 RepID=UPI0006EC6BE0|nr:J domain-containing protein [Leptolyngbya sp. NIES-2104]GAP95720.1 DnaJ-class molecular chaperone [Leptolyngbya sp. NIES-2104]
MSFQIDRGLFLLDFSDYHAILGVSIEAEVKEIRKQYLKIARCLHPDSCSAGTESDKQLAEQLLSKLVNPAWQHLSQDKTRTDHLLVLKMKGQGAAQKRRDLDFGSSLAKQLLSSSNPDYYYRTALKDLSDRQYEQLDQAIELTSQISELNLAYLISREGNSDNSQAKSQIYTTSSTQTATKAPTQPSQPKVESLNDQFYRRAEGFMAKGNYAQATIELRDALKIEPNSSRCHSLMGMVYLRQNQPTMAKIHFTKAIAIDPQDPIALEGKQKLDPPAAKPALKASTSSTTKPSGGLFGGLFGKKK